ncbi:BrnT family toxin [Chloroflexi bacterium CFX6]|nr:BrnT family toxin [Chloroflexi bacterium CFX6]
MKFIFQWDDNKARINLAKHKVSFEEGKTIFYDPFILTFRDEFHSEKEDRLISIGMSVNERLLLVVHLEREDTSEGVFIRIVSCRKATASERRLYEENE